MPSGYTDLSTSMVEAAILRWDTDTDVSEGDCTVSEFSGCVRSCDSRGDMIQVGYAAL